MARCPNCGSTAQVKFRYEYWNCCEDDVVEHIINYACGCGQHFKVIQPFTKMACCAIEKTFQEKPLIDKSEPVDIKDVDQMKEKMIAFFQLYPNVEWEYYDLKNSIRKHFNILFSFNQIHQALNELRNEEVIFEREQRDNIHGCHKYFYKCKNA